MERSLSSFIFSSWKSQAGFTLIEAIVTLVIAGIFVSLAAPSAKELLLNSRRTTAINRLIGDLAYSRNEAIKRGHPVTICRSSTGTDCMGGDTWQQGWIVFADVDDDQVVDPEEVILRAQEALSGVSVRYRGTVNNYVRYRATGLGWPAGTFTFCDVRGPRGARSVVINTVGRPYTSTRDGRRQALECPT